MVLGLGFSTCSTCRLLPPVPLARPVGHISFSTLVFFLRWIVCCCFPCCILPPTLRRRRGHGGRSAPHIMLCIVVRVCCACRGLGGVRRTRTRPRAECCMVQSRCRTARFESVFSGWNCESRCGQASPMSHHFFLTRVCFTRILFLPRSVLRIFVSA